MRHHHSTPPEAGAGKPTLRPLMVFSRLLCHVVFVFEKTAVTSLDGGNGDWGRKMP